MRWRDLLAGPLPPLSKHLDHLSERWWSLAPRLRVTLTIAGVLLLPLAGAAAAGSPHHDVEVLVATRDLPAGTPLATGHVSPRSRPASDAPSSAIASLPADVETAGFVPAGAVITQHDLTDHGLAGSVSPGRVAVAVPTESLPAAALRAGQRLDLLAGGADGRGDVVASDARVLSVEDEHVWLEVTRDEAARVAGATAWGSLGVALMPPG